MFSKTILLAQEAIVNANTHKATDSHRGRETAQLRNDEIGGESVADQIVINGKLYSKRKLCLDWFRMSNDMFFKYYGFNFNPHNYQGLYEWGREILFGEYKFD